MNTKTQTEQEIELLREVIPSAVEVRRQAEILGMRVVANDGGSAPSDDLAERVAAKVVERLKEEPATLAEPEKLFINIDEAAKILGITRDAAEKRIERRQIPGVVRTGRRIQIDKARMLAGLAKRSR